MKITPDHLARGVFIYIQQSTSDQLVNNHESWGTNMVQPSALAPSAGLM
jgi:hypothetical protein